ncbi:HET-domain-containing protein [Ustulina deusta]|nr:HET-domain-containing protein [Ustulina deusta]
MRLLHTKTLKLETFIGARRPHYAILSHTWGDDEVLFEDIQGKSVKKWKSKAGAGKVLKFAEICADLGIAYIWIDTCCIDKSSSSELSEAINSMYKWYQNSLVCYAYLSDIDSTKPKNLRIKDAPFRESQWFRRGWTVSLNYKQLQELIAPADVQFSDQEWRLMGERANLAEMIHRITGIDESLLRNNNADSISSNLRGCSVHTKMVWASGRITTRVEDRAYSLMGGGGRAFARLQEEIIKRTNDQSILLHGAGVFGDHLAESPNDFKPYDKFLKSLICHNLPFQKTRGGVDVSLGLYPTQSSRSFWGIIEAYFSDDPLQLDRPAIQLGSSGRDSKYQREDQTIYRVRPGDEGQMEVVGETGS